MVGRVRKGKQSNEDDLQSTKGMQCCHHVDPPHPSRFALCKFALSYVIPQTPPKIGSPWPASSECWIEERERMRVLWLSYYGRKRKTTIADCHLPKEHRKQIISSMYHKCLWLGIFWYGLSPKSNRRSAATSHFLLSVSVFSRGHDSSDAAANE